MANNYPFIHRLLGNRIKKLFNNFSSVVITGARQVGKSTLLQHLFPDLTSVVFDPVHDIQNAKADPELFLNNNPPPIILDEIQFAPELVPVLKRKIDSAKKPGLYLLTGSQQWGILKNVAESLAGRAAIVELNPFCLAEIAQNPPETLWLERWLDTQESFSFQKIERLTLKNRLLEQLWRGFLPESQFLELDLIPDFHFSYQKTYIEKDIRLLADVSDLQLFSRFVKLAAALTAQEVNYSQLGREIGITSQTAKRWLDLLIQTFEWFEIPAFSNNSVKKVSLKTKGYFSDVGQVAFSQSISSPNALLSHPLWGAIFENAVVSDIKKQAELMRIPPNLYHWRLHSGAECDLILERDGKYYPIEIKANSRPKKADARGLQAFRESYKHLNVQKGLIIAPTEECYPVTEHDYVIPWDLR